jgi:hypothetical protein
MQVALPSVWGFPSNGLLFMLNLANVGQVVKPLNAELNPIRHLLALLAHHIFHVSGLRVKSIERSVIHTKSIAISQGLLNSYLGRKAVQKE